MSASIETEENARAEETNGRIPRLQRRVPRQ